MQVHYQEHAFEFEPSPGSDFVGRLILDDRRRELLAALTAAEDECWYLGDDDERLPKDELFARSPWRCPGADGPVKLLCRWLDLHDGTARFNTPELYLGEFFRCAAIGAAFQTPNQALQQTAGHDSFLGLHSSPVPRRC